MTFKSYLKLDRKKVLDGCMFRHFHGRDDLNMDKYDKIRNAYNNTIEEFLPLKPIKDDGELEIEVYVHTLENDPLQKLAVENNKTEFIKDENDFEEYLECHFINKKFEGHPQKDLKFWGGNGDDKNDCPEGHYNVNYNGYQEYFGMGMTDWDKLLDLNVVIRDNVPEDMTPEKIVGEIMWELTFNGFTQEKMVEFRDDLQQRSDDLKSGKTKGIPSKT